MRLMGLGKLPYIGPLDFYPKKAEDDLRNFKGVIEMMRLQAPLVIIVMCFSSVLSGCVSPTGLESSTLHLKTVPAYFNVDVASLMLTKKTVFDHVATFATGQDCSTPRAERDGPYCAKWPEPPAPPPEVYCYATLARPTCYSQAYNQSNDHLVGFVPASVTTK